MRRAFGIGGIALLEALSSRGRGMQQALNYAVVVTLRYSQPGHIVQSCVGAALYIANPTY